MSEAKAPALAPEPGWTEVWPFPFGAARRTFTGSALEHERIAIRYFRRGPEIPGGSGQGPLVAKVWFGPGAEGAPGHVHGGGLLSVLDEAMGAASWIAGHPVMTVRLNATFRLSVPLRTEFIVETKLGAPGRRIVPAEGRLISPDGTLYVEAQASFIRLSESKLRDVFKLPRPHP
jgi:acyl-coenzyme A thioesterase PaaI-like protein